MKLERMTPNLMVTNIDQSIHYYKDTLGFEVVDRVESNFVILSRDGVTLMMESMEAMAQEYVELKHEVLKASIALYFRIDDVEKLAATLKTKGYSVPDIYETFYGTVETYLVDPDGYILTLSGEKR
ncbi:VOC family protein [Erysipelothrix anatis]|uniref:VOC family protein n=1 Tax=Erysipelothrix anatis TaxID=2683713 RepID=UPI001358CA02|nr:VOC family protein [Erysipelothrix anatis]